jgi:hypothetical protein
VDRHLEIGTRLWRTLRVNGIVPGDGPCLLSSGCLSNECYNIVPGWSFWFAASGRNPPATAKDQGNTVTSPEIVASRVDSLKKDDVWPIRHVG